MSDVHISSKKILSDVTTTGAGSAHRSPNERSFQAVGLTTNGAGAATIKVQVSNDGTNWIDLGSPIQLTLATTASSDGFSSTGAWAFVRGNVTALSGTGASVSLIMGF